jgi:hypothetical protein
MTERNGQHFEPLVGDGSLQHYAEHQTQANTEQRPSSPNAPAAQTRDAASDDPCRHGASPASRAIAGHSRHMTPARARHPPAL